MPYDEIARLVANFAPLISNAIVGDYFRRMRLDRLTKLDPSQLPAMGVHSAGSQPVSIYVTDLNNPIGSLRVEARGHRSSIVIDNAFRAGAINGNLGISNDNSICVLSKPPGGAITLGIVVLRSKNQLFFMGPGSTAVGLSAEIEGEGKAIVIGEDALISSGVWIRNHDMHSIIDLQTNGVSNSISKNVIIEPHVWIGQDALILGAEHVGYGSIIGAKAFVRQNVPSLSAVAGVPGRIIRTSVSWGRALSGMSEYERTLLDNMSLRRLGRA